ncbi:MAG TPA: hypothetical protein VF656_19045 [Pyrinomonadaceae bacterium]|jgi:hypothetical protein
MDIFFVDIPHVRPLSRIERAVSYEQLLEAGVPLTVVASSNGLCRSSEEWDFILVADSFLDLSVGVMRIIYDVELPMFGERSSVVADCDEAHGALRRLAESVISAEDRRLLTGAQQRPAWGSSGFINKELGLTINTP